MMLVIKVLQPLDLVGLQIRKLYFFRSVIFIFIKFILFVFIFGCVGSLLLRAGFL